ncbi:MAG: DUF4350 domain-containing protein [Bacteroidia bacterium]
MKKYWLYITLLVLLFSGALYVNSTAPKELDWRPTFSQNDKIPYGTYILFELLPEAFPDQKISTANAPFYELLEEEYQGHNLIIINNEFSPDKFETEKLLEFAESGNNIFIAAENITGAFADTFDIISQGYYEDEDFKLNTKDSVPVGFSTESLTEDYQFEAKLASAHLKPDSSETWSKHPATVLGSYYKQHANFIRIPFGEGSFYINSTPKAFSNFSLRDSQNWTYAFKCLSYLPLRNVLWDEHYKGSSIQRSQLSFILSQKPLRWAYYILVTTLLLYILFEGKRRQKIIPVLEPLKNTSLEFADTVGRLYFQTRNHKTLALKKISHFNDFLQTRLYIKLAPIDAAFMKQVQLKAGMTDEETKAFFDKIIYAYNARNYTEENLKRLNKAIDEFYKRF